MRLGLWLELELVRTLVRASVRNEGRALVRASVGNDVRALVKDLCLQTDGLTD